MKKQALRLKSGFFEPVSSRDYNKSGVCSRVHAFGKLFANHSLSSIGLVVLGFDDGWTRSEDIHHSSLHHLCGLAPVCHVDHLLLPDVLWIARVLPSGEWE